MQDHDTDRDWEEFGQTDPYWAVITVDDYRQDNLTDDGLARFYDSGETHVRWFFDVTRRHLDGGFAPRTALDFGCGVGRLALPLARRCRSVVGVDVSAGMLDKARQRCRQCGVSNLSLVRGDDELSAVAGPFDLVTAFIVLQHIPPARGERLFRRLVGLVADGGVGVLHVTYSKEWYDPETMHREPDGVRYHFAQMRRAAGDRLRKVLGRPRRAAPRTGGPVMQMNDYNLNRVFHLLQAAGVRRMHVEYTNHGGPYGVALFFRKGADESYAA